MRIPNLIPIRYDVKRRIAILLSMVHLNHLKSQTAGDFTVICKRRRFLANFVIWMGNWFLEFRGCRVVVLSTENWVRWEQAVDSATGRNLIVQTPRQSNSPKSQLLCRRIPGVCLSGLLRDIRVSDDQKLSAVRWSLTALCQLHQVIAEWEEGLHQSISHGDATSNNVIVDINISSACWIDFDMRHRLEIPEMDRRTDDLRTFIYSAATGLSTGFFPDLATILVSQLQDFELLKSLQRQLNKERNQSTLLQLAQSPLTWSLHTQLTETILNTISASQMD